MQDRRRPKFMSRPVERPVSCLPPGGKLGQDIAERIFLHKVCRSLARRPVAPLPLRLRQLQFVSMEDPDAGIGVASSPAKVVFPDPARPSIATNIVPAACRRASFSWTCLISGSIGHILACIYVLT